MNLTRRTFDDGTVFKIDSTRDCYQFKEPNYVCRTSSCGERIYDTYSFAGYEYEYDGEYNQNVCVGFTCQIYFCGVVTTKKILFDDCTLT